MSVIELPTKIEGTDRIGMANYDFGDNLDEMKAMLTERGVAEVDKVVYSNALGAMKVSCRSLIKRLMKAGKTDVEIQEVVSKWTPGIASERVSADPFASALAQFSKKTPEEQAAFLADLQARLGGQQ